MKLYFNIIAHKKSQQWVCVHIVFVAIWLEATVWSNIMWTEHMPLEFVVAEHNQ